MGQSNEEFISINSLGETNQSKIISEMCQHVDTCCNFEEFVEPWISTYVQDLAMKLGTPTYSLMKYE